MALFVGAAASSCGARTGLLFPLDDQETPTADASGTDGIVDAGADTSVRDATTSLDALPPIDVAVPPDVSVPTVCADAASTLVYLISEEFDLLSFDPSSGALTRIGQIACPTTGTCSGSQATPFSMAVDETGLAYVVYCDGELFQVSTADAQCQATGFAPGQNGFPTTFGMGFVRSAQGTGETLYVAGDMNGGGSLLGSIDTSTFALSVVGPFNPPISKPELTSAAAGELFGFYGVTLADGGTSSAIAQVDDSTGQLVGNTPLPQVTQGDAWAFAFWGGNFYTFTSPLEAPWNGRTTRVQRFDPNDGTVADVFTIAQTIVGAGVSTCAPQQ